MLVQMAGSVPGHDDDNAVNRPKSPYFNADRVRPSDDVEKHAQPRLAYCWASPYHRGGEETENKADDRPDSVPGDLHRPRRRVGLWLRSCRTGHHKNVDA